MVGLGTLNPAILVRIQAPEQSNAPDRGSCNINYILQFFAGLSSAPDSK